MARSPLFASLSRLRRLVHNSEARGLPVEAAQEAEQRLSRRALLGRGAALGGVSLVAAGPAPRVAPSNRDWIAAQRAVSPVSSAKSAPRRGSGWASAYSTTRPKKGRR